MSVLGRALPSRVLLVDDDELELELMADRLEAAGFEVACASHGEAALQLIEQQWYPLVITDWLMPVMDGIAFTEELRGRGPPTPTSSC
jgi:CheY-like chemotaxis protein